MRYLIAFAGPIGSSKSPIAHYLSLKFNLPILSNDVIRTEVIEDMGILDETEFRNRLKTRILNFLESGKAFVFDASVDRQWQNIEGEIFKYKYKVFLISLDLSFEFLEQIYKNKNYQDSLQRLKINFQDHQDFLKENSKFVSLSINDQNFLDRLSLSQKALSAWLKK